MKEGNLLLSMSLPMIASMLVQAMYNIVDSIFVSRIGENSLTAVSLSSPVQFLLIAFGTGVGVGMNALLSKALGEGDSKKANDMAKNGLFLALVNYVIFLLVGLFFVKTFRKAKPPARTPAYTPTVWIISP